MRIEAWDRTTLLEQERVIGRQKGTGAPNGLTEEFDELNLDLVDNTDTPLIDVDAHVRLASHQHLNGIRILRRGCNFTDGSDGFGHLDAGLFFIAFVRNPVTQFIPMQAELARSDALNEYITTPARRCSPARRVCATATTGARRCWTDRCSPSVGPVHSFRPLANSGGTAPTVAGLVVRPRLVDADIEVDVVHPLAQVQWLVVGHHHGHRRDVVERFGTAGYRPVPAPLLLADGTQWHGDVQLGRQVGTTTGLPRSPTRHGEPCP